MTEPINKAGETIISFISLIDSTGVTKWSYRYVAGISALIFLAVRRALGVKGGMHLHGLLHAIVVSAGAIMCTYLDLYASETMTGTPEPLRMIRCMGPLTNLHKLLPSLTLGYSICDVLDSFALGREFIMHGLGMASVLVIVCELELQHTITQMLLMEVSTVFLNLLHLKTMGPEFQIIMQLFFVISFLVIRVIVVPYLWGMFVYAFYEEEASETNNICFPHFFIYIVLIFGLFFHSLNLYWVVKIIQKVLRKLTGREKMQDTKME